MRDRTGWGLYKCDCGIDYCEYFAPGKGETGESFTREELENIRDDINDVLESN